MKEDSHALSHSAIVRLLQLRTIRYDMARVFEVLQL